MISARPPNAAAGNPPPMTLPKVNRSGGPDAYGPSSPYHPEGEHRNPVITSSLTTSAPCSWAMRRSPSVNPSTGGTTPMLPAAASVMTQAISGTSGREGGLDGGQVVVGQHDRLGGRGRRHARAVRQPEGRDAGAGRREQRVDVAVVAAGELHDDRPPGEPAGQPDRGHRRLRAAVDEAHLLGRGARDDLLCERDLVLGRRAEREPAGRGRLDRLDHRRVRVPEDHRPPRPDEVDVPAAVDVGEPRPRGARHEPRRAARRRGTPAPASSPRRG